MIQKEKVNNNNDNKNGATFNLVIGIRKSKKIWYQAKLNKEVKWIYLKIP